MEKILGIIQVVISVLLMASILLQRKGEGLSSTFGGQGGGVYFKKRGMEKVLFVAAIILAVLFILSAIIRMVIF